MIFKTKVFCEEAMYACSPKYCRPLLLSSYHLQMFDHELYTSHSFLLCCHQVFKAIMLLKGDGDLKKEGVAKIGVMCHNLYLCHHRRYNTPISSCLSCIVPPPMYFLSDFMFCTIAGGHGHEGQCAKCSQWAIL